MADHSLATATGAARDERTALNATMARAAGSAAAALSEMAGRCIANGPVEVHLVPLQHLAMVAGDPERPVVAIHLGVQGCSPGHILVALSEKMACGLVDMLMAQPEGSTDALDDMGVSALAECGNVSGTFFLTALAESSQTTLAPTPPTVLYDMCGAILDTLAAELALLEHDEAMVIETQFTCDGQIVDAAFFMFPAPAMISAVLHGALAEVGHASLRN